MYDRAAGYRSRKSQSKLNSEQKKRIEKVLPCPHDPVSLSGLYLTGQNKLRLEEDVARRNNKLLNLNSKMQHPVTVNDIHGDICLI